MPNFKITRVSSINKKPDGVKTKTYTIGTYAALDSRSVNVQKRRIGDSELTRKETHAPRRRNATKPSDCHERRLVLLRVINTLLYKLPTDSLTRLKTTLETEVQDLQKHAEEDEMQAFLEAFM